jgi:Mesyanzhinovviridae DNA primase
MAVRYRPQSCLEDEEDRADDTPAEFLKRLRPNGPWLLTAIIPDGPTKTITAYDAEDVRQFVRQHDGSKKLYFSVNPTRDAMASKAAKVDIAAVEYLLADLDPKDDERPDEARTRYLSNLQE